MRHSLVGLEGSERLLETFQHRSSVISKYSPVRAPPRSGPPSRSRNYVAAILLLKIPIAVASVLQRLKILESFELRFKEFVLRFKLHDRLDERSEPARSRRRSRRREKVSEGISPERSLPGTVDERRNDAIEAVVVEVEEEGGEAARPGPDLRRRAGVTARKLGRSEISQRRWRERALIGC